MANRARPAGARRSPPAALDAAQPVRRAGLRIRRRRPLRRGRPGAGAVPQPPRAPSGGRAQRRLRAGRGEPPAATGGPLPEEITAYHAGRCLDVDGQSTGDGARVQQYTCNGGGNQRWQLRAVEGDRWEIVGTGQRQVPADRRRRRRARGRRWAPAPGCPGSAGRRVRTGNTFSLRNAERPVPGGQRRQPGQRRLGRAGRLQRRRLPAVADRIAARERPRAPVPGRQGPHRLGGRGPRAPSSSRSASTATAASAARRERRGLGGRGRGRRMRGARRPRAASCAAPASSSCSRLSEAQWGRGWPSFSASSRCTSMVADTGFTRWALKPASVLRRRSCSCP